MKRSRDRTIEKNLLENPFFTEFREKLIKIIACEDSAIIEQKKRIARLSKEIGQVKKGEKDKIQGKIITAISAVDDLILEKVVSPKSLDFASLEVEKFLEENDLSDPKQAAIEDCGVGIKFCFYNSEEGFYDSFKPRLTEQSSEKELIRKIDRKRYEINPVDFVRQVGEKFEREKETVWFNSKKVELYFEKLEKEKEQLRQNPNLSNDFGFFDEVDETELRGNRFLKIYFCNHNVASVDIDDHSRLKFWSKDEKPNPYLIEIVKNQIEWGNSDLRIGLLNEATLDLGCGGRGFDFGHDLLSIEICLARAKKFLVKVKPIKDLGSCRVGFSKKDKQEKKPFLRLSKKWESGHKNLFSDGIKIAGGGSFDGKAFFKQILKGPALRGYLPVSYFFEVATKIEVVESENNQYPDKLQIEINQRKHEKWIAENLPIEN